MAFVTTQDEVIVLSGFTPNLLLIKGTYTNSGGGTGGVIAAGYTNSSGTLTAVASGAGIGGRKIVLPLFTPTTNDATAPGSAQSYNATIDSEIATMVTTANSTGIYVLLCKDNGI